MYSPLETNFDVNRKPLSLQPFVASFKHISLNSDFIHIFLMFFQMYIAPGQGQTTPWGQNPDVNRKTLSLCPFIASFKKISLNFYINVNLLSLWSFAVSFFHLMAFNSFPHIKVQETKFDRVVK